MIVDINELQENSWNINNMSELKFNALVHGIKEIGSNRLFPLEVLPKKDWKYILIDWKHRLLALKEAWITTAYIEISELDEWYAKLRTLSKNMVHWESTQIDEADLIANIKLQWIQDSEILQALWISEIDLSAMNDMNMPMLEQDSSEEDEEEEEDEKPEIIKKEEPKEITLSLTEMQYDFLEWLEWYTWVRGIQDSILIVGKYFQYMVEKNRIDEQAFDNAKEIIGSMTIDMEF